MRFGIFSLAVMILSFVFSISGQAQNEKGHLSDKCFTVTPVSKFDDIKCAPVKAQVKFTNCKTRNVEDDLKTVTMRFECKAKSKKLKYWYRNSMLFAELEKSGDTYVVTETHSMDYGTKDNSASVVTPLTAVKSEVAVIPAAVSAPAITPPLAAPPVSSPAPVSTPVVSVTPTPSPLILEPKSLPPLNDIKIGGAMDFYYLYNFALPAPVVTGSLTNGATPNETVTYLPKKYHDQFTLNLAMLSVKKEAKPVGFKLELAYGSEASVFSNDSKNVDMASTALAQAVIIYKTPFNLEFEAGKFFAPVGYEGHYAFENMNYTDSYGHIWATPVWLTGVKATMPLSDSLSVSFYAANGWNTQYENNASKTMGGQIKYSPFDELDIILNGIGGNETPVGGADIRTALEATVVGKVLPGLKLVGDFISTQESISGGDLRRASSAAGYVQYWVFKNLAVAGRYEVYSDDAIFTYGLRSSNVRAATYPQTINSITGTVDFKISPELSLKGEYRNDRSDLASGPFLDNTGSPTQTQSVGLLAAVLGF